MSDTFWNTFFVFLALLAGWASGYLYGRNHPERIVGDKFGRGGAGGKAIVYGSGIAIGGDGGDGTKGGKGGRAFTFGDGYAEDGKDGGRGPEGK